jgi:hypothetical protein
MQSPGYVRAIICASNVGSATKSSLQYRACSLKLEVARRKKWAWISARFDSLQNQPFCLCKFIALEIEECLSIQSVPCCTDGRIETALIEVLKCFRWHKNDCDESAPNSRLTEP